MRRMTHPQGEPTAPMEGRRLAIMSERRQQALDLLLFVFLVGIVGFFLYGVVFS